MLPALGGHTLEAVFRQAEILCRGKIRSHILLTALLLCASLCRSPESLLPLSTAENCYLAPGDLQLDPLLTTVRDRWPSDSREVFREDFQQGGTNVSVVQTPYLWRGYQEDERLPRGTP